MEKFRFLFRFFFIKKENFISFSAEVYFDLLDAAVSLLIR